jgi:hypothetical protein
MARRELVFKDEITIWRDGDEFVAEWDNGYQPDRRFKRSYYNKSDNVILAVKGLLDELIEDGVIPVATTQEWRA